MKSENRPNNRRQFIKTCGLSTLPLMWPGLAVKASLKTSKEGDLKLPVNFIYDGLGFSPKEYLAVLNEIQKSSPIQADFYGNGGATKQLEEEFAKLSGKEKAIYLPTGTMANQIAIKLLSGNNTKVIVPENSHVFRDEADAAQSVHNKRLVPVGKGKAYFEVEDLISTIQYTNNNEVFKSGLGAVVLEHPIRRANGTAIPIDTIKAISSYCKENGYKLHLDGARIHLAAAFTNISVGEYASYFDTIYVSLYKYLNASGGAMLCGDAVIIDQVAHQIKIYGGTVFQSWNNTAVALHYLKGIDQRWKQVIDAAHELTSALNQIDGLSISAVEKGTNIYHLIVDKDISLKTLANFLYEESNIWLGRADEMGRVRFTINESLLHRPIKEIIESWKLAVSKAR